LFAPPRKPSLDGSTPDKAYFNPLMRNVSGRRRWSKLQEWLRPGPALSRPIGMAG
jgi:hypothetical protein